MYAHIIRDRNMDLVNVTNELGEQSSGLWDIRKSLKLRFLFLGTLGRGLYCLRDFSSLKIPTESPEGRSRV
jgi:hypothetical protein